MIIPTTSIKGALQPLIDEVGVEIVYKRYLGTDRVDGANEDQTEDTTLTAITGKPKRYRANVDGDVVAQAQRRSFFFRDDALPSNIDLDEDLGNNDKIEWKGQEFDVAEVRHIRGIGVRVEVEGG